MKELIHECRIEIIRDQTGLFRHGLMGNYYSNTKAGLLKINDDLNLSEIEIVNALDEEFEIIYKKYFK